MTQISIPATALFFWGLYVTIFGHLVDFVNFGRFRQFLAISGRGRNFAILAFAKPGKWHKFLYQPQQYFSGAYMWHFSGSLDFSPISAIFESLGNLGKVFVLRSSISAIFVSLGNLCFKDFDFDHFGHFGKSWESWEVFVLRSHFPWFFGSSKGAPLQNRQQHPIFHFLKFSTGFRGLLRFCSPKPISTWKWLYVRRTEPIISLI